MPLSLPKPIADYFAADATEGTAVAKCFTADAVVIDEKQTHRGREAIARWKTEASAKYHYDSEPVAIDDHHDRIIVSGKPGAPSLRFHPRGK